MKAKTLIIVQMLALVLAIGAGAILSTSLTDGPRLLHRAVGGLGTITGLIVAVYLLRTGAPSFARATAWSAFILSGLAGFAGASLKTAENYQAYYLTMRLSGFLALVLAGITFVLVTRTKTRQTPQAGE